MTRRALLATCREMKAQHATYRAEAKAMLDHTAAAIGALKGTLLAEAAKHDAAVRQCE